VDEQDAMVYEVCSPGGTFWSTRETAVLHMVHAIQWTRSEAEGELRLPGVPGMPPLLGLGGARYGTLRSSLE
jgi:hypothetical protein